MQEGGCVKDRTAEKKPATVSKEAKQAGESRARWPWVEPEVWTDRMLTALEQGVFAECGLFSLTAAHSKACQSSRR